MAKQVQSMSHTFYQEGAEIMNKMPVIENYIEINGKTILIDSLPKEKREEIAKVLQDKFMESMGYQRIKTLK